MVYHLGEMSPYAYIRVRTQALMSVQLLKIENGDFLNEKNLSTE